MNKELSKFTIKEVRKDIRKVFKEVENPYVDIDPIRIKEFEQARDIFKKSVLKIFK